MSVLYPTHHCFDDAIEFCQERAREGHQSVLTTLRVVHGIILVPADQPPGQDVTPDERAVHAWVEDGDLVWDAGMLADGRRVVFSATKDSYYEHYRIQETTRYTMWEVLTENRRSGHFGPWKPEYRALCRASGFSTSNEVRKPEAPTESAKSTAPRPHPSAHR